MLGIRSEALDLLLYGLDHNRACEEIADQLQIELAKVQEIQALVQSMAHMRQHAYSLLDDDSSIK